MSALHITFYIGLGISVVALIISYFRGDELASRTLTAKSAQQERPLPVPVARGVSPDARSAEESDQGNKEGGA